MVTIRVDLASLPQTGAACGWAGGHTVIADRPEGRAGGTGLGFNGGQLLALSIGGCFCNDLRYMAEKLGLKIGSIAVAVTLHLEGDPLLVSSADMEVDCRLADGSNPTELIAAARQDSTVGNSVARGFAVNVHARESGR